MVNHFQGFEATGDIASQVQMRTANGKHVASCQLGIVEERTQQGQKTQTMVKHTIECWGELAKFLASIPQGHTVMVKGKLQNYKYKGQDGQERWGHKISVFTLGNCGPSKYAQQSQQQGYQQQQGGYPPPQNNAYPPQSGGGTANYPPQNQYPPQQQGYPPQQPQQNQGYPPGGYPPPAQNAGPTGAPNGAPGGYPNVAPQPQQQAQTNYPPPQGFDPNETIPF